MTQYSNGLYMATSWGSAVLKIFFRKVFSKNFFTRARKAREVRTWN